MSKHLEEVEDKLPVLGETERFPNTWEEAHYDALRCIAVQLAGLRDDLANSPVVERINHPLVTVSHLPEPEDEATCSCGNSEKCVRDACAKCCWCGLKL